MPTGQHPVWRSLLYVPANVRRFIAKAHTRGADAIILDLEDSVPPGQRPGARAGLADAIAEVGRGGADVLVRVNPLGAELEADLAACERRLPRALVLSKVESVEQVRRVAGWLALRPAARQVGLVLLIESARGLQAMAAIAAADRRNLALALGGEDFALDVGMVPAAETLELPKQLALYAARAAGLLPLGLMGSIADMTDLEEVARVAERSRRFGFEGAACIHPALVPVLNAAFTPGAEELEHARRVVAAYEFARGRDAGSVAVDGRMVDRPVAERARALLARHRRILARERARSATTTQPHEEQQT